MNIAAIAISSGVAIRPPGCNAIVLALATSGSGNELVNDLLCGDVAGRQRIHPHAFGCVLQSERLGHAKQSVFGKRVGEVWGMIVKAWVDAMLRMTPLPLAIIQEQSLGIHYNKSNDILDYISNKEVFHYEDGFVSIPQGPGLGIEVDEAYVVERAKEGHRWRNPIWRHADGSFAEW